MVENNRGLTILAHTVLIIGMIAVCFPLYMALVASTHPVENLLGRIPGWFGPDFLTNYSTALGQGMEAAPWDT